VSEGVREYVKEHADAEVCDHTYIHTYLNTTSYIRIYIHSYNTPHTRIVPMYLERMQIDECLFFDQVCMRASTHAHTHTCKHTHTRYTTANAGMYENVCVWCMCALCVHNKHTRAHDTSKSVRKCDTQKSRAHFLCCSGCAL
jgi:hypothetical protein